MYGPSIRHQSYCSRIGQTCLFFGMLHHPDFSPLATQKEFSRRLEEVSPTQASTMTILLRQASFWFLNQSCVPTLIERLQSDAGPRSRRTSERSHRSSRCRRARRATDHLSRIGIPSRRAPDHVGRGRSLPHRRPSHRAGRHRGLRAGLLAAEPV